MDEWEEYKIKNRGKINRALNEPSYLDEKTDLRRKEQIRNLSLDERYKESEKNELVKNTAVTLECLKYFPKLFLTKRGQAMRKKCLEILKDTEYLKPYSEEFLKINQQWELEEKGTKNKEIKIYEQDEDNNGPEAA